MNEQLTPEKLSQILDEVGSYEINLEVDPTLPHLGNAYLQKAISTCRNYMNRVNYYMQMVKMQERTLRTALKTAELDFDMKISEKLADDALVRKQPSIEDRKALAMTMLRTEHELVATIKSDLQDIEETGKLLKMKYDHLKGTVADIKMQRSLVKDDAIIRMGGEDGYSRPVINQNGTVPNGMRAPVTADPIDPKDLLDPNKRPEHMPEPLDNAHAQMIANFFKSTPTHPNAPSPKPGNDEENEVKSISYEDLLS
jgi:hypothetical protein